MNRVEHFRRARFLAIQDTERFRMRYWNLRGGFAWSLEEFVKAREFNTSITWSGAGSETITIGVRVVGGSDWGWNIIDYSDIWFPDRGSSVSSLSERRRMNRWMSRDFPL